MFVYELVYGFVYVRCDEGCVCGTVLSFYEMGSTSLSFHYIYVPDQTGYLLSVFIVA